MIRWATGSVAGGATYTHEASNRLLSSSTLAFNYDSNGNTTSKTDSAQQSTTGYTWNVENRLTSVVLPTATVTFKYDPFGRRIQKSGPSGVTNYVYDGANIVAEYDSAGNVVARYTQGGGIDEPLAMQRGGTTAYYNADALGSITALTDSAGSAIAAYTTDAFGKSTLTAGDLLNPFRYTGREWDVETGLYYYRARYYDPSIGRFISEDPLGNKGGNNFYAYVGNNPMNFLDPTGLKRLTQNLAVRCSCSSGPRLARRNQLRIGSRPPPIQQGERKLDSSIWSACGGEKSTDSAPQPVTTSSNLCVMMIA